MKLKKLLAAVAVGFAATSAMAAPVSLDAISGSLTVKMTGLTTETNLTAGSTETTWGIGAINQLLSTNGDTWSAGTNGQYLYYMIYGIADQGITGTSPNVNIFNTGATGGGADGKIHFDLYLSDHQITSIDSSFTALVSDRNGYNGYAAYNTLGPAWLQAVFTPGLIAADDPDTPWDETLTSLFQTASSSSLPATGAGSFYADVVGGTDYDRWNTNTQDGRDMFGTFTLSQNGITPGAQVPDHGTCPTASVLDNTCFAGYISDPIVANRLPEPTSLALFGLGLAGLAGLRRRKQQ
jgi:hypothetical protein